MASVNEAPGLGYKATMVVGLSSPTGVRTKGLRARVPGDVLRFAAAVLLVNAAVAVIGFFVLSQDAISEAERSAQQVATVEGTGIVEPALTDGLLSGDQTATARLDQVVRARVLDPHTVRVKIWESTGRILYSDEGRLIGQVFPLGPNELAARRSCHRDSYLSDLTKPENRYEGNFGQLLEV